MNAITLAKLDEVLNDLEATPRPDTGEYSNPLNERENGTTDELRAALKDTDRFLAFLETNGV